MDDDDRAWVLAAQGGDRRAFDRLFREHLPLVFRSVLFQVRQRQLAEDICQEVFLQAYRHLSDLRDPDRIKVWLLRIAQNRIRNHWRDQARRPAPPPAREVFEASEVPDPAADPRARAEQLIFSQQVLAGLERLTVLQRQVITLRFISGLSAAETGAILDRSENAVHNLQHHGLAALRRHLGVRQQQEGAP